MQTTKEIRKRFLKYFENKGHLIVPSSSVVPHDDPTLLFTNAGMNQFKDIFLGKSSRDYKMATTAQKCIRAGGKHNDLENVGHTKRHLTFFEMLGNFSFGAYFKEEAIQFAWEMSTEVFQLDSGKIWASVFREDDEAYELWKKHLPESRIIRLDEKDNFWMMGDTGPCGPCSELLFDKGAAYGEAPSPREDSSGERYQEFWNLVFMQYDRLNAKEQINLPKPCIDTGAGLERVVGLIQGTDNVFETDILRGLIRAIEERSGIAYCANDARAPAFRVIADHLRCLTFAIADGAAPGNVERGYVLRKILRRAVRYGKSLGFEDPFLASLLPALIHEMQEPYPEIAAGKERIADILSQEEESFFRTLKRGGNILSRVIEESKDQTISGDDAFKLKDTYGLPLEEIQLIAKDAQLKVDIDRYLELEQEAKERSKVAQKGGGERKNDALFEEIRKEMGETEFLGYEQKESLSEVVALIVDGAHVQAIEAGEEAIVLLDLTPFYAEMGGQVGDRGSLKAEDALFQVTDCQISFKGLYAHSGILERGTLKVGDQVAAAIDQERRKLIANNHTATHLLHLGLEQVLGGHIKQAGSVVDENRLRFDFSHHKALSLDEMRAIERKVNASIRENIAVETQEIAYTEVLERREIKQFFGDKYDQMVRLVDIKESKELCGGTHAERTGDIGCFKITSEASIGAGIRRIEAVTGKNADEEFYRLEDTQLSLAKELKANPILLLERVKKLLEEHAQLQKEVARAHLKELQSLAEKLSAKAVQVGNVTWLSAIVAVDIKDLKDLADQLANCLPSAVIALAAKEEGRCQLLIKVSQDLISQGIFADALVKKAAPLIEGKGGGKKEMAQAGGKESNRLEEALSLIGEQLHG
ncbi:MAG: alaS [Chlamydiales bacterium]|nr:alaS [Chlamydiales bacterium]